MIDLTKYDGHTPGPWEQDGEDAMFQDVRSKSVFDEDGQGIIVCDLVGMPFDKDTDADARLIADAPLLKSELARIYSELTQLTLDLENGSYTESITKRLRNILEGKIDIDLARTVYAGSDALCDHIQLCYAEIDRLRSLVPAWTMVTDDPATMPELETSILVVYADSGELALAVRTDFNGAWMSHFDRYEPTPGDRWAYIPEIHA